MAVDGARERYLRDRVLTASPAQRVVMLYDRLGLDLNLASSADELGAASGHIGHALLVLAELRASLDLTAGGPAENLASIYGFLLAELIAAQTGDLDRLESARTIVGSLREAWAQASDQVASAAPVPAAATAGRWVG
jgi:flagellar protein FliS